MQNLSYPAHDIDYFRYIWKCQRLLFVAPVLFGNWKYIYRYKDIQDIQIARRVNPEFAGMTYFGNGCLNWYTVFSWWYGSLYKRRHCRVFQGLK